jgi:hypothetical protein
MHADTVYHLRAVSTDSSGFEVWSQDLMYKTGSLPPYIPEGEITVYEPDLSENGWTLMNVSNTVVGGPRTVVMYDMDGKPVWYYAKGDTPGYMETDVSLVDDGAHVLICFQWPDYDPIEIDLSGEVVWYGPEQPSSKDEEGGHMHHQLDKLSNGNYLFLRRDIKKMGSEDVLGDAVVEMNPELQIVWEWSFFDWLEPKIGDWTHANTAIMDFDEGVVYVNSRNLSALFKIRKSDGQILWRFGENGDFSKDSDSDCPWFDKAHDPEILPDGNILFYDNGTFRRGFSRVVEYSLDEDAMQAEVVWEYPGSKDDVWFTGYWGDADRLENGNTLITAGTENMGEQSRVFEVTPDLEIVWEMRLPADEESTFGIYRSERVEPPLVEPI